MTDNRVKNCPKCGYLSFDGAVCTNDNCNFPAHESRNARRDRERREAEDKARRQHEAEAKRRKNTSAPKPTKPPADRWEKIGGCLALAGGLGGVWLGVRAAPETPLAWVIVAVIGAGLAYALRKLIVIGGGIIAALTIFASPEDKEAEAERPTARETAARSSVAPSLTPVPPVTRQPIPDTRIIDVLCLRNDTNEDLEISFSGDDDTPARFTLKAGYLIPVWTVQPKGTRFPVEAWVEAAEYGSVRLPMGRTELSGDEKPETSPKIDCGPSNVPEYALAKRPDGTMYARRSD